MKDLLKEYIHPQKHIRGSRVDAHATAILLREGKYSREDIQNAIQDVSPNAPLSKCAVNPRLLGLGDNASVLPTIYVP